MNILHKIDLILNESNSQNFKKGNTVKVLNGIKTIYTGKISKVLGYDDIITDWKYKIIDGKSGKEKVAIQANIKKFNE